MKRFLIFFLLLSVKVYSQSEFNAIHKVLTAYIEGTAKGDKEKLKKAFHKDFNLYLNSADTLRIIKGSDYINRIESGKIYNRKAKIISIDCEYDTAIGKIEVFFPDRNQVATDYLLLLKEKDGWKIVHKIIDLKSVDIATKLPKNEQNNILNLNKTLLNYIEGTANGEVNRIKKAFKKGFNLYYIKDNALTILPGSRYLKNFKEGVLSNRIGKVIGFDFEDTAAYAKIEVRMPDRNRRVIDFLLLLKIQGEWQIIHKSFTTNNYL